MSRRGAGGAALALALVACGVETGPRRGPTTAPRPEPAGGAVVVRWGSGPRGGWELHGVVVDGRRVAPVDEDRDGSVTILVAPGRRSIRLLVARAADPEEPGSRQRRLRTLPVPVEVEPAGVRACAIEVAGEARPRPRLVCDLDRRAPVEAPAPEETSELRALEARVTAIEGRLAEDAAPSEDAGWIEAVPSPEHPSSGSGVLEIALSGDLAVTVDDRPAAVVSSTRLELPEGRHVVRVEGPDVVPYEATVSLAAGERVLLAPVVSRRRAEPSTASSFGFLNLSSTPWAEVYSGGRRIGTTPLVMARLPVGLHRLTLMAEGHGPGRTIAVAISPDETTRCHAEASGGDSETCETPARDEAHGRE